jgi:hypothetical protein
MERAPARLAPSIRVWLRGFGAGGITANFLPLVADPRLKRLKPSSLFWTMTSMVTRTAFHHGGQQNEGFRAISQINSREQHNK